MQIRKNAQSVLGTLGSLPKPDFKSIKKPDISALMAELGNPIDPAAKKTPGQATGIEGTLIHEEPKKRRAFYDLASGNRAVKAIGRLPELDESFHCLMSGDYHGFDLVIAVRELAGVAIEHLHVATLGFNRHNISHLCAMLDRGAIGSAKILCSEYFAGADADTFTNARDELARRGQILKATRSHAKILLFAAGPRRFVVESSANLRSCNNLEQFALTQSAPLYEFHRAWIERVLAHG